jgi:DNA-directed RNA polymerase subunit M
MFCPKCGSLLRPKIDGRKKLMSCSGCNYKSKDTKSAQLREKIITKKEKDVEVIDKGELNTLPLTNTDCPKCHHKKAYFWLVQTRAGDEPETKFLKCEKCGHTWRDYD